MKEIGKIDWAFLAGRIPFRSTGDEPEMISHDKVAILNITEEEAVVELFIFYEDEKPVGPFEIKIEPKRLKKVGFNFLIDPTSIYLERNYSCYLRSNVKVVVQFSRMNTGIAENAEMGTMAFPVDS